MKIWKIRWRMATRHRIHKMWLWWLVKYYKRHWVQNISIILNEGKLNKYKRGIQNKAMGSKKHKKDSKKKKHRSRSRSPLENEELQRERKRHRKHKDRKRDRSLDGELQFLCSKMRYARRWWLFPIFSSRVCILRHYLFVFLLEMFFQIDLEIMNGVGVIPIWQNNGIVCSLFQTRWHSSSSTASLCCWCVVGIVRTCVEWCLSGQSKATDLRECYNHYNLILCYLIYYSFKWINWIV